MLNKALSVALLPTLVISLFAPAAFAAEESDVYAPDPALAADPLGRAKHLDRGFNVGEFTGAGLYEYPLALPEGRNGMTPTVQLTYNSQSGAPDNRVGWQWNLNLYSIRRFNKVGAEQLYERNDFVVTTPVDSGELVGLSLSDGVHGVYGQKVEQAHAKYEFLPNNRWRVTDKQGVQYIFGATPEARQFDPGNPNEVYAWYLEETRDPNGNFIRYTYAKHGNQIYPKTIRYTGHGQEEGIFEVRFLPFANGSGGATRPDKHFSYSRGFRVDTNHLLTGAEVWADGEKRRDYQISYTNVAPIVRQTISQITETAYNLSGQAVGKPPTVFEYTESRVGWSPTGQYSPDWIFEECYYVCSGASNILQWDMNGDGLEDFEFFYGDERTRGRALNNGNGSWTYTNAGFLSSSRSYDNAIPSVWRKPFDFSGDLLTDIVASQEYVLSGSVRQVVSSIQSAQGAGGNPIPIAFGLQDAHHPDNGAAIADLNGDGLPDIIQRRKPYQSSLVESATCLNRDGQRCEETDLWRAPREIITDLQHSQRARDGLVQDCNLDGLADFEFSTPASRETYINNGRGGWIKSNEPCRFTGPGSTHQRRLDANGDGLIDSASSMTISSSSGPSVVYNQVSVNGGVENINQQLEDIFPITFGSPYAGYHQDYGVRILDLNGDLLDDIIYSIKNGNTKTGTQTFEKGVWLNTGSRPYFLKRVQEADGGTISYQYKTSAQYKKSDGTLASPKLPIIVTTLQSVSESPGIGSGRSVSYFYEDGHYQYDTAQQREFAGFRKVTKTESGIKTVMYFHQGSKSIADTALGESADIFSKIGKPYRSEIYDQQGHLARTTINRIDLKNRQPVVERSVTVTYNTDTNNRRATAVEYGFDSYGNRTSVTDFGEVNLTAEDGSFTDTGNDMLETRTTFTLNENGYLVGYPAEQKVLGQSGQTLSHQRFYYDDLDLGDVIKGNPTHSEQWLDTENTFLTERTEFNEFGLPVRQTNPRGFSSVMAYDSFNLYPTAVTNALGHSRFQTADPMTGQSVESTDENGVRTVSQFDGFGRVTKTERSGPDGGGLIAISEHSYDDQSMPRSVHAVTYNDDGASVESYQYFDGMGRLLVAKQEASGGQWVANGQSYNSRGLVAKQFQPFFSSQSGYETLNGLGTSFYYDALDRVVKTQTPLGQTLADYDVWNKTVTDLNGHTKTLSYSSRGELVGVTERNGGDVYETAYIYDGLGRLTGITDANGNQREFTYDSLGRRLTQTSAHPPGEAGSKWSYRYDENGNMKERTDALAQSVRYQYDALDRLVEEDFEGTETVEWTFDYDDGPNAVGRLSEVVGSEYQKKLTYDAWGRAVEEQKTIHGRLFGFGYEYDQLGAMTAMTYPDGSQVAYSYDGAHQLEAVFDQERVYADQLEYSPLGQIERIRVGDQALTVNQYDENQLYRLTNRSTTRDAVLLQEFGYEYDPVGNLLTLSDQSFEAKLPEAVYSYDDLNRLKSATFGEQFTIDYAYDPIGNITHKTGLGAYEYGGQHPHAVTQAGERAFGYDANGNQVARNGVNIAYDYKDLMMSSGGITEYAYDEGKQRISKTDVGSGERRMYVNRYFEADPYEEVRFVYAGDLKIAKLNRVVAERAEVPVEEQVEEVVEEAVEESTEQPVEEAEPEPIPAPQPGPDPAPSQPTPSAEEMVSLGIGSGNGGGSMRLTGKNHQLHYDRSLLRLKEPTGQAIEEVKEERLESQSAKRPKLPEGVESEDSKPVEFTNLRITYRPDKAILKWDGMPEEVLTFGIYRSIRPYPSTASKHAGKPIAHIKASGFKNVFTDEGFELNERYSYQIAAKNADGHVLSKSVRLHADQAFIHPDGGTLDLRKFSDTTFNKVYVKPSDYFEFAASHDPTRLRLTPKGVRTGAEIFVRFLQCEPKSNGMEHCVPTDEKTLEIYLIDQPKISRAISTFSRWLAGALNFTS